MGDLVLIGSCAGAFHAFDKASGQPVWSYDVSADGAGQFHGDPLVKDDVVYIGTDGATSLVYAFDRDTGNVRWKTHADQVSPGITGFPTDILPLAESLYTVGAGDHVVSLGRRDGAVKWTFHGKGSPDERRYPAAAALAGGRLLFAGVDGTVHALDPATGSVVWKRDFGAPFTTSVVPVEGDVIVGAADRQLYRLRPADGSTVARIALSQPPGYTPVVQGDVVLISTGRELLAIRTSLTKVLWSQPAVKEWSTPRPRVWNGLVVAGDGGNLRALDLKTGEERWKETFEGTIRGIGSEGDVLFIGTLKGHVYAFRPVSRPDPKGSVERPATGSPVPEPAKTPGKAALAPQSSG